MAETAAPVSTAGPADDERRVRAVKQLKRKRDFYGHAAAYVIINVALVVVWYIGGAGYFWPMWVMFGWGIGLAFHAWDVFGPNTEPSESAIQREMQKMK